MIRIVLVIVNGTIRKAGLEVLKFFNCRFDVGTNFDLLKSEALVNKTSIDKLIANRPHVFLCHVMHIRVLSRQVSELLGAQAQLLRYPTEEALSFLFHMARRVNSWDESNPNFVVLKCLNKTDICIVYPALFDSDPLKWANVIVLRHVVLIHGCHLLCR